MRYSFKTIQRSLVFSALATASIFLTASAQQLSADQSLTIKRDLAGVLGEVHYIRTLCNGSKDQYWRNFMSDFLKHEAISQQRKSLFTAAFNRGYKFQSQRLSRCDSRVAILEVTLASKGRRMAESIAAQYMN